MSSVVIVGRFGKAFGVAGWIKVHSLTSPKEEILEFRPWLVRAPNKDWQKVFIESSRVHAGSIIVKLPHCDSPECARNFTNNEIAVLREQLPKLKNDEYYWDDLIGLKVINKEGVDFGMVKELIATGSNDVLIVMGDRKRLIPYISSVIVSVDVEGKIITVDWDGDF